MSWQLPHGKPPTGANDLLSNQPRAGSPQTRRVIRILFYYFILFFYNSNLYKNKLSQEIAIVHVVGHITNRRRQDGKMVGAAAAVMPRAWREDVDADQPFELGEGVTQYDVDAFGISLAGPTLPNTTLGLRSGGQARRFIILSRSQSAISGISNQCSRSIQEHALNFVHVINLSLMELWSL